MDGAAILSSIGSALTSHRFERDNPGFRVVINRLATRGLVTASVLGATLVCVFFISVLVIRGKTVVWWYPPGDLSGVIVLWDKTLILLCCAAGYALSRSPIGTRRPRLIVSVLVVVVVAAIVIDDVANGDYRLRYVSLAMIVTVGLMPYSPIQAIAVCGMIGVTSALSLAVLPPWLGLGVLQVNPHAFLLPGLIALAMTAVSTMLYRSRTDQYVARREAEDSAEKIWLNALKLRQVEALKDRFFTNLSHEFRTPLTLLLSPLDDALEGRWGALQARAQRRIEVMRRNGQRLLTLINQLLDLSRLEEGLTRITVCEQDLVPIARVMMHAFSSVAERKEIELTFEANPDQIVVTLDREAIDKVLSNLMSNAVKYTPAGGTVRMRVDLVGDEGSRSARIRVRDTGPGIDPADQAHVFDRFYQGSEQATDTVASSGLGLALSAGLVHLHGGDISVESELGFGSEFEVTLPLGRDHFGSEVSFGQRPAGGGVPELQDGALTHAVVGLDEDSADADLAKVLTDTTAPSVLLVDDDPDLRGYLVELLANRYRVFEAADGSSAKDQIAAERPDLVISDVMMPGMSGIELCHWIRRQPLLADIPVMLVTALAENDVRIHALTEGADEYICKPFSTAELLARAENLIEIRRIIRSRHDLRRLSEPSAVTEPSADEVFLERVRAVVEEQMDNTQFGVEWLADEVGLGARQLSRRLQKVTELSAGGYIRMMRLQRAAQLLHRRVGNVSEVAYMVGFRDAAYFSRLFRQTFGMTPTAYAKADLDEV